MKTDRELNLAALEAAVSTAKEAATRNAVHLSPTPSPTIADLTRWEEYDASRQFVCPFRKKDDMWKGLWVPFGNMCGGFGFDMHGVHFYTSESAYICGLFSAGTPEQNRVQEILAAHANGKTAKGDIRFHNLDKARDDWHDGWNIQWMLHVVWEKVKGNRDFRELLLAVPYGAVIVEDSTFHCMQQSEDTATFWGTRNAERKEFHRDMNRWLKIMDPTLKKAARRRRLLEEFNASCDLGVYRGRNIMGKILTICRDCVRIGAEPKIDHDLLNAKHIHLMGKELRF